MPTAAPILTVRDVVASVEFYQKVFQAGGPGAFPANPSLGYVTHGEVELYGQKLMFTPDKGPPATDHLPWRARVAQGGVRGAGVAFQIDLGPDEDVAAVYQQAVQRGAKVVVHPEEHWWGVRLFVLEDPDGYLLYFSQRLSRPEGG